MQVSGRKNIKRTQINGIEIPDARGFVYFWSDVQIDNIPGDLWFEQFRHLVRTGGTVEIWVAYEAANGDELPAQAIVEFVGSPSCNDSENGTCRLHAHLKEVVQ